MTAMIAILSFGVGTIFGVASLAKAATPTRANALANYAIVPASLARLAGIVLILIEAATATLIFSGFHREDGLVVAGLLLLILGVASYVEARRDPQAERDCGCLGAALPIQMDAGASVINICLGLLCLVAALVSGYSTRLPNDSWLLEGTGALSGVAYWVALYARSVARRTESHSRALAGVI